MKRNNSQHRLPSPTLGRRGPKSIECFERQRVSSLYSASLMSLLDSRLAVDHSLRALRVASPLHRDLRRGAVNVVQVCLAELNGRRREILLQAMQFRRPWNRHDPGLLGKQPGECDLGGRRLLAL